MTIPRNSLSKHISNMWKWKIFLWPSSIYLCLSQADLNHLWNSFKLLVLLLCDTIMFHTVNVYLLGLNHLKLSVHTIFSSRRIVLLCTLNLQLTKASCFVIDHLSSFKWISCCLFIYLASCTFIHIFVISWYEFYRWERRNYFFLVVHSEMCI